MPNEAKIRDVADLTDRFKKSSIVIATDFTGIKVNEITGLRKRLREQDVEYRVVKNRLASIAATESGKESVKDILEGATGIVIGYGDPVEAAKTLDTFIKENRSRMAIRKGVMNGTLLTESQVASLASLPSRERLIGQLLGQMNAPISGLVNVLSGPARGLAVVLQRRAEQLSGAGA